MTKDKRTTRSSHAAGMLKEDMAEQDMIHNDTMADTVTECNVEDKVNILEQNMQDMQTQLKDIKDILQQLVKCNDVEPHK